MGAIGVNIYSMERSERNCMEDSTKSHGHQEISVSTGKGAIKMHSYIMFAFK